MRARPADTGSEDAGMTDAELKKLCDLWQGRLKLQDWRIDARMADSVETDGQFGKCRVSREGRLAIVRIQKEEAVDLTDEFSRAFPSDYDPERSLVHELLHIPLEGIIADEPGEHERVAQEQAIEQISAALYEAYRKEG